MIENYKVKNKIERSTEVFSNLNSVLKDPEKENLSDASRNNKKLNEAALANAACIEKKESMNYDAENMLTETQEK